MRVIVQYTIELPRGRTVTEQDLEQNFEAVKDALKAADDPYGYLLIRDPDQGREIRMYDDIQYLVVRVCLDAMAKLREGAEVVIDHASSPGSIQLKREGAEVAVTDRDAPSVSFGADKLLPALLACGSRYVAAVQRLRGDDPRWELELAQIHATMRAAHE
jgi:hypothetical protein